MGGRGLELTYTVGAWAPSFQLRHMPHPGIVALLMTRSVMSSSPRFVIYTSYDKSESFTISSFTNISSGERKPWNYFLALLPSNGLFRGLLRMKKTPHCLRFLIDFKNAIISIYMDSLDPVLPVQFLHLLSQPFQQILLLFIKQEFSTSSHIYHLLLNCHFFFFFFAFNTRMDYVTTIFFSTFHPNPE